MKQVGGSTKNLFVMRTVQRDHERYAVTLIVCKHKDGEQDKMRKYATQRLIAKDVPVHLKGLFEGQNLRFRGRGSRKRAVDIVMNSKKLRDKYGTNGLLARFNQDLPLEFADRMSVYCR